MYAPLAAHQTLSRAPFGGMAGFFGVQGVTTVGPFRGPRDTLDEMAKKVLGEQGERSFLVRRFTEWVVSGVNPKDYLGEILAIRNMSVQPSPAGTGPLFRYVNDPRHVELIKSPERLVREIVENGACTGDCDDVVVLSATMCLQIGRNVDLVAMGFAPHQLSHVVARAQEPKSGAWIVLDGVAGPREAEAAGKAVEVMVLSLD